MPEDYAARFSKGQNPELRLMKKLEHCANARCESTAIIASRLAEREQARLSLRKTDEVYREALGFNRRFGEERWVRKLSKSPYLTDLATEYTLMTDEQDMQRVLNESKAGHVSVRKREAEEHILQKAYSHGIDEEMAYLRAEKRELYWKERELKALRDKERTDSRIARIRANKRQETLLRQTELAVARAKSAALHGEPGRATSTTHLRSKSASPTDHNLSQQLSAAARRKQLLASHGLTAVGGTSGATTTKKVQVLSVAV
ncbi:unnamed protein product [Amoebophrya sp. A120]|nr:unnamed protein product [Amoebophrya sp. A120]|eukprot:GSA120T00018039001.1